MSKKLRVKVVGCGGVGLCVLNVLPRYLNHQKEYEVELSLIDGDVYEIDNKSRQAFTRHGNKAEVTAEAIRNEFPNIYCWTTTDYLTEDNIGMIVRNGDVIFSCVDNHATRKLLSDHCETLDDVLLISGGNDYTDGNIQVHIRKEGQNVTLPIASYKKEIANPADKNPGDARREGGCEAERVSKPQLLITNNLVAALMLNAFYGWTQGIFEGKDKYGEVYADVLLNKTNPRPRS